MTYSFDKFIFVDSELAEHIRESQMESALASVMNSKLFQIDWKSFIQQWRLSIAEMILEQPEKLLSKHSLEGMIRLELDIQLFEFQIDGLKEAEKVQLCKLWFPEEIRRYTFNASSEIPEIFLPISILHAATLLKLFKSQLVEGEKLVTAEMLDAYRLELDAYQNLSELVDIPLDEMVVYSDGPDHQRALECLGLKKNITFRQALYRHNSINTTVFSA